MKKVIVTIAAIIAAINFSGCNEGGSNDSHFKDAGETIKIVSCSTGDTALESGDVIVKDEDATTIKTTHNADSNKTICVGTGQAHIVRQ